MTSRTKTNHRARIVMATIVSIGGNAPALYAQESGDEAGSGLEEIVVTAQRRAEKIQDVPISIQAISGDALRERGITQVQDLQNAAPNVTITSPLGAGSAPAINIRGIGLNDFNTNNSGPNGVYVDEFAISSPNAQGLSFFDIERVEVLKGPQGTLYGRNASGGAINITTAKPTDSFDARTRLAYGSYNTLNAEAAIGGPLSQTLSGRLSGGYNYSDGYMRNHLMDRDENGTNMGGARAQLLWKPSEDFSALLKTQYVRNKTRAPMYKLYGAFDPDTFEVCSVADTLGNRCVDLFGYAGRKDFYGGDWNNGDQKVSVEDVNSTLRMEYQLSNGLSLVSVTGYNDNERFHPEQTDAGPARSVEIEYLTDSTEFTQELRLSGSTDRLEWVLGAFYLNERITQDQPSEVLLDLDLLLGSPGAGDGIAYIAQTKNKQRTESEAIFSQVEFKATDQLSLIAGARQTWEQRDFTSFTASNFQEGGMDHFGPDTFVSTIDNDLSEKNFSWKLGLRYKTTPDVMLFATVATAFKAGGFNGGFLAQDPALRAIQLEPFDPEEVTTYESGVKAQLLDRNLTLNVAAFYSDYKNQQLSLLVADPRVDTPVFVIDNAEKARIYGIDADITYRVTAGLTVFAQLGYLDTEMTKFVPSRDPSSPDYSGNRLSLAPELTATPGINYQYDFAGGTLGFQYNATYRSKQFFEPSNSPYLFQDPYWIHNARISYAFQEGAYEVAAYARNFADKEYLIWNAALFDPFGIATGTVGEPRSFGVEFNFKY